MPAVPQRFAAGNAAIGGDGAEADARAWPAEYRGIHG
jgi:hypothetical protein